MTRKIAATAAEQVAEQVAKNARIAELTAPIHLLPAFSAKVFNAVIEGLYAEPGFSDVTCECVADRLGCKQMQVVGALKKLSEAGLLSVDSGMTADTARSGQQPIIYPRGWEDKDIAEEWILAAAKAVEERLAHFQNETRSHREADGNAPLHMAHGKRPLCGAVDEPSVADVEKVTCPKCQSKIARVKEQAAPATEAQVSAAQQQVNAKQQAADLQGLYRLLETPQGRAVVADALALSLRKDFRK